MTDYLHLARELAPRIQSGAAERDAQRLLPIEQMDWIRQACLGAARVPMAFGGGDVSQREVAQIFIVLGKADPCVAQALFPHFATVEHLRLIASGEQQSRYLTGFATGRLSSGAIAERGGTFRGEIHTRLCRDAEGLRLDGEKFYSTGCLFADLLKIQAIDEADEAVYVMLPRNTPGLTLLDDWDGMGQRTTASGTTRLENVRVSPQQVIPLAQWYRQRNYVGASAQLIHCSIDVGIGLAALDDAILWARDGSRPVRESGVDRARDDPYILHTIGELSARIHGAEALVEKAADVVDRAARAQLGGTLRGEALESLLVASSIAVAEAKIASTRAALFVCERLYDVGGAATTQSRHNFDRHWRNARTHTTHDALAYKFKAVGDFRVNGHPPPIAFTY
ncbi:sulfur acquisition oxidoreductase, SfnB family [Pseudomonas flavescens]|uniref:Sulfur acquisition oxidoreductase, SfnB family n=1 Tax=Phytopseudomonas flavescens TaxID=29435 RepID=A0A1G8ACY1_9GAMM|nr:acyl-CoA dehydrogenase family protein [Pseudomonas flavescens]SDH18696.1 sulfur acquisition oxidoreductase, SfnB family [Pseudomonas flavescens]